MVVTNYLQVLGWSSKYIEHLGMWIVFFPPGFRNKNNAQHLNEKNCVLMVQSPNEESPRPWEHFHEKREIISTNFEWMDIGDFEPFPKLSFGIIQLTWNVSGSRKYSNLFKTPKLVGGFNPFEKYARQNGNLPQISGWKFQKCLSCHHPVICIAYPGEDLTWISKWWALVFEKFPPRKARYYFRLQKWLHQQKVDRKVGDVPVHHLPNTTEPTMYFEAHAPIHPWKINGWNTRMEVDGSDNFPFSSWVIFRLHITLPETNIVPKNGWLEYYFPIGETYLQGRRAVSFREGNFQGCTRCTFEKKLCNHWSYTPETQGGNPPKIGSFTSLRSPF